MWLEVVRDVAIVLLALESLVIGALLIVLLFQTRKLVSLMRDEVVPMLEAVDDTVQTVHGTTTVVAEAVVKPLARASGFGSGVLQTARSLLTIGRAIGRQSPR